MPITARAVTNAIGMSDDYVAKLEGMGAQSARTEAFKIDTSGRHAIWGPETDFLPLAEKWYLRLSEDGGVVVGDLLSREGDWGLIAMYMYESGVSLRCSVQCMFCKVPQKRVEREVWTRRFRFQVSQKRVYGYARKPKTQVRGTI